MDSLPQEVFSLVESLLQSKLNGTSFDNNGTSGAFEGTTSSSGNASSPLATVLALFLSVSAIRDWFKLFLVGGVIEFCRRWFFWGYEKLVDSFFVTVYFDEDDEAYEWMLYWVSQQTKNQKLRQLEVTTRSFGLSAHGVMVPGETDDPLTSGSSRKLSYLPSAGHSYRIWYKRHWMSVERQSETVGYRRMEKLCLCIFTHSLTVVNELLLEAKRTYKSSQEDNISIYAADTSDCWDHVATRPKRALNSVVLEEGIQDLVLSDSRDFLSSKEWYSDRGIPFRRGYLLWGPPGCGKTSLIHCMAGELGLDVYILSLSRRGMDDAKLNTLIHDLPERCIALMEDVDAAFKSRDSGGPSTTVRRKEEMSEEEEDIEQRKNDDSGSNSGVTLSGLLNALDGIGAAEGRILFATTNHYESLDPALCRPGRMDVHVEFKLASKHQARELFRRFYLPTKRKVSPTTTTALSSSEKLKDTSSEKQSIVTTNEHANGHSPEAPSSVTGQTHIFRAPELSDSEVTALADKFVQKVPERELSMAAIQGYLMVYKTRPVEASENVGEWVEKERADRAKKMKGKRSSKIEVVKEAAKAEE